MVENELSDVEKSLVGLSVQRYQWPLYRRGHLLSWLSLPLLGLTLVPGLKAYDLWFCAAACLFMFSWYYILTVRIIGKLATRANIFPVAGATIESQVAPRGLPVRVLTLIIYLVALPVVIAIQFGIYRVVDYSHQILDAVAAEAVIGGLVGVIVMTASIAGSFLVRNRLWLNRAMELGANLLFWSFLELIMFGIARAGIGLK